MSHFESDRLKLRNYRTDDWERVHIYASVSEFSQFELWGPNTIDDTKKFVADMVLQAEGMPRFKFDFAVVLKESDQLIGGCGIRRDCQSSIVANLGWAISPDFQNMGYATEAAQMLIQFGFEQLGLRVVYATCDTQNAPSIRVMEKLGLKPVGLLRGDKMQKGYIRDTFRFEVTGN